jgi:parvulin-like peptidyl-prolyl isomerase
MTKRTTRTRKQLAISRRQREQQRQVIIGLIGLTVLIVLVLSGGFVYSLAIVPGRPVAVVNATEITVGDYRARLRYERFILDQALADLETQRQSFAGNETLANFLEQQFQQSFNQLVGLRLQVDRDTIERMIEEELVVQEAERLGITISAAEVKQRSDNLVAGRAGGFTEAAVAETATARTEVTLTAALFTPTATLAPAPTLTTTAVLTTPAATVVPPTPLPTSTPVVITTNTLAENYRDWLKTLNDNTGLSEAQYLEIIHRELLQRALADHLADQLDTVEEQVHVRHILVGTEEEALAVKTRLDEGQDFAEIAAEVSTDTSNNLDGGDLGFFPRGVMIPEFEEVALDLPIGQVSDPVETQFGWHVLEVLEREQRELEPPVLAQRQQQAYRDWVSQTRTVGVQSFWTPDIAPPDPELLALRRRLEAPAPQGSLPTDNR